MLKLPEIWKMVSGHGAQAASGTATLSLLTDADLALDNGEFNADDPDIPDFVRDRLKEKQHEKQIAAEVDHRQREIAEARKAEGDNDRHFREWLASEQYRRAVQELSADIGDARAVAREAYGRAFKREQAAEESLEDSRRRAIVLSDGRRVYFTKDGSQLYSEERGEVTDAALLGEAQRLRRGQPDATTYEEYVRRCQDHDEARRQVDELQTTLGKLDELDNRIKGGKLTPEDLAQAQLETKAIVDGLPQDAREAYEQRKSVREQPDAEYRSAATLYTDAASFRTAVDASGHFDDAVTARTVQAQPAPSQAGAKVTTKNKDDDYRQGL